MAAATEIEAQKVEGTRNVEAFFKARLAKVQKDLEGVGAKWKVRAEDLRKSLQTAPQQVLTKVKGALGEERFVKLTKLADAGAVKEAFAGLQKRLEGLKVKVESLVKRNGNAAETPATETKA